MKINFITEMKEKVSAVKLIWKLFVRIKKERNRSTLNLIQGILYDIQQLR